MKKMQVLRFVVQGHTPMEENEMSDTDRKTISCFPSTDLRFFLQKKKKAAEFKVLIWAIG